MTALVIGELTADRSTIILIATGPDHEVAGAAAQLQTLTPLIKPTDPAGAVQMPASWAAVVQLSATFAGAWRPGPALMGWIGEQLAARTGTPGELTVSLPRASRRWFRLEAPWSLNAPVEPLLAAIRAARTTGGRS